MGGSIGQSGFICQVLCSGMQVISAQIWGSTGQSGFICQVLYSGMQVISALVWGGLLAKMGSSAKFCVVVCKSSLLRYGGLLAKEGSSAKFCVVVCKSSLLWYWGGSIGQSGFICQVLCSGMQVISALVLGGALAKEGLSAKFGVAVFKASILNYWGSISQSRFVCQVWYSSIPDIYAQFLGDPSAKVSSSAKFCVLVFKAFLLWYRGVHRQTKIHLPNLNSGRLCVVIKEVFSLRARPINGCLTDNVS